MTNATELCVESRAKISNPAAQETQSGTEKTTIPKIMQSYVTLTNVESAFHWIALVLRNLA